ncbi:glycosyltransferase [Candidatus Woesearchaeota archaeon]|nr:glycosyltransferase [Candidatus Woesearchaeota archaeon]
MSLRLNSNKMNEKIWAVIPAMDEGEKIGPVIRQTKKYVNNVLVVDDGSTDNTSEAAKKSGALVLRHMINLGKGAAVKTGCDFILKKGAEKIILLDSDGQHDPKEIPNFLDALENADIVFGYRKFDENMPLVFKIGNNFINFVAKVLYGIRLKDTQSGYRAFTNYAYRKIRWTANDYSMESEMIANMAKKKLRYKQIPIKTIYSEKYKGTTVMDGVKIVLNMLMWRMKG